MVIKGNIMHAYRQLLPISKSLRQSFTADCNYGNSPRREAKQARLIEKAQQIADSIDLDIYVQGDPRGCSLYLIEKGRENPNATYNTGIAIY